MNPFEYLGTFFEFATHPAALWKEITELSEFMEHRSANMMVDIAKQNARNTFDRKAGAVDRFNETGMKGLELVDRLCVAPGWLALYRKEYNRLSNDPANIMSESDIKKAAALKADEITMLVQPSANPEDMASIFRGNNELGKALLQFTQSLNVIWQNVRYDVPYYIREKQFLNATGTIMGYTIAGILVGVVTLGFDEDDDEAEKAKKLAWWATTQFTDSFPIIGSTVTGAMESVVTGNTRYQGGLNLFPPLNKARRALEYGAKGIREKDFEKLLKAAEAAMEAAMIAKGLPASGLGEASRATGIGDGEAGFHPEALLGRRDY
jgi:hypothetical protein